MTKEEGGFMPSSLWHFNNLRALVKGYLMNIDKYNFNTAISRRRSASPTAPSKITPEGKHQAMIRQRIESRRECIEAGIPESDWNKIVC